jgi:glutamine amidotransferase
MPDPAAARVAIVDFGMGNLFSVQRACEQAGLRARVTDRPADLSEADAVILPGVGAFGDAMATLTRLGFVEALRDVAASGKPLFGICLGLQLLMTESQEFGRHRGLGIVAGDVVRFEQPPTEHPVLKVPQVGWNRIAKAPGTSWEGSPLEGVSEGAYMYFVHSFYVRPADPHVALSVSRYGQTTFCSSLRSGNIFACQFHPERSGPIGLGIYRRFAAFLQRAPMESRHG